MDCLCAPQLASLIIAGVIVLGAIGGFLWISYQIGNRRGYMRATEDFRRVGPRVWRVQQR